MLRDTCILTTSAKDSPITLLGLVKHCQLTERITSHVLQTEYVHHNNSFTNLITHTVTLQPAQGAALTLRGFLVQGRTQVGNDMVGAFLDPSGINALTQLSLCTPREVGVTHNNPNRIDQPGPFTFQWTAPAAGTGPIWFRYTIMQNVSTWWADDSSAIVQEGGMTLCVCTS